MAINGVWVWRWNDIHHYFRGLIGFEKLSTTHIFGESNFDDPFVWDVSFFASFDLMVIQFSVFGVLFQVRAWLFTKNNHMTHTSCIICVLLYKSSNFSFRSHSWQENGFFFGFFGACGRGAINVLKIFYWLVNVSDLLTYRTVRRALEMLTVQIVGCSRLRDVGARTNSDT